MRALARQVTAAARTWPRASTHPCRALATLRGQPAPTSALACPLPQRLSTPPLPSAARLSNPASQYSSGLLCAGPPASLSRAPRFPAGRWMTSHVTPVAGDAAANTEVQQVLSKTRVAVAQMTACNDTAKNFETVTQLAEDAVSQGAKMLFLPENFNYMGVNLGDAKAILQPVDGPFIQAYQQLARDTGLWLSLGGFQEKGPDDTRGYNTQLMINDKGDTVSVYRKIHLFDVDVPNGPVLMESRSTAPGDKVAVCDTPAGRVGLTTCYDVRFPELYQQLTWDLGAQILTVPSAFTKVTGAAHWEVLLRARAIECQAWVIAAAQAGKHNERRESYGHALIVDPWGTVVAKLPDPLQTGIAVADIDLGFSQAVRDKMPIAQHRAKGHQAYFHDKTPSAQN